MATIRLIVGLGNPGERYRQTRHNVGAECVQALAARFGIVLADEPRFKGRIGRGTIAGHDVRLLVPQTFMNLSGESVGAVAHFYKFAPEEILVVYDEMAFEPGVVRLRSGGGDNGHNGIRSVIAGLGNSRDFHRLRIGVGHPGQRDAVTAYLTQVRMPEDERIEVGRAMTIGDAVLADLLAGNLQQAMNRLHGPAEPGAAEPARRPKSEE
ncbi:MAG: aminoacyl-tRNA hydrolase [Pseudomonadales bacterium]|nr:aminoacyl-tRNA hydrolase [Pseudomonadales bacterium]